MSEFNYILTEDTLTRLNKLKKTLPKQVQLHTRKPKLARAKWTSILKPLQLEECTPKTLPKQVQLHTRKRKLARAKWTSILKPLQLDECTPKAEMPALDISSPEDMALSPPAPTKIRKAKATVNYLKSFKDPKASTFKMPQPPGPLSAPSPQETIGKAQATVYGLLPYKDPMWTSFKLLQPPVPLPSPPPQKDVDNMELIVDEHNETIWSTPDDWSIEASLLDCDISPLSPPAPEMDNIGAIVSETVLATPSVPQEDWPMEEDTPPSSPAPKKRDNMELIVDEHNETIWSTPDDWSIEALLLDCDISPLSPPAPEMDNIGAIVSETVLATPSVPQEDWPMEEAILAFDISMQKDTPPSSPDPKKREHIGAILDELLCETVLGTPTVLLEDWPIEEAMLAFDTLMEKDTPLSSEERDTIGAILDELLSETVLATPTVPQQDWPIEEAMLAFDISMQKDTPLSSPAPKKRDKLEAMVDEIFIEKVLATPSVPQEDWPIEEAMLAFDISMQKDTPPSSPAPKKRDKLEAMLDELFKEKVLATPSVPQEDWPIEDAMLALGISIQDDMPPSSPAPKKRDNIRAIVDETVLATPSVPQEDRHIEEAMLSLGNSIQEDMSPSSPALKKSQTDCLTTLRIVNGVIVSSKLVDRSEALAWQQRKLTPGPIVDTFTEAGYTQGMSYIFK